MSTENTPEDLTVPAKLPQEADPPGPDAPPSGDDETADALRDRIVSVLKTVYDPEIPVDIYELGLIYEIDIDSSNAVRMQMTLTSPMCPVAETLPPEVESKVRTVRGVAGVTLDLVWDPPWSPDMMSEAAKLELNF